ncbi:malto-oligosyltrehalose synthase [Achromobacter arsenitoxydans]|uniref:Malto-oligosyltrehalose synthase n=1 Tax=Achromobacter arsenitoxydans SY8 TaxID=477184 RepID=H0FBI1_9BURK|nr:malto-oligosyltrehalose synthase [Achromobacter arsenitoxydans]EHK64446.1 malto-oligosyltrehalose synthase [Achromobacter arsenitoxydans SY8]
MSTLRATARLQLHAGYTLDDACAQVDYYADLGVSHLYLSPVTRARAGSTHGYDVIDHAVVNPELGGEPALLRLAAAGRARGLGLIADIVPNHMAAHPSNAWWRDVLAQGQASAWSRHFDIDWEPPAPTLQGKVLLPVLADPYGAALEHGVIRPCWDAGAAQPELDVGGQRYPLAASSAPRGADPRAWLREHDPADPDARQRLHALLERQHYRLAWWRTAPDLINWRRFFEISELVGVRVEDEAVFDDAHALVLRLYAQGILDGVRIDHIDGLVSPGAYLRRLSTRLGEAGASRPAPFRQDRPYLVVEKILAYDETLDPRWSTDGTTGYDFMDQAGALLHDPDAQAPLRAFWATLADDPREPGEQLRAARMRMLARHFPAERQALVRSLTRIAAQDLRTRDWTATAIDRALTAWLAAFPVYRTYAEDSGGSPADAHWRAAATRGAAAALAAREGNADATLLAQLNEWLGGACPAAAHEALRRFQQLTPPLAAKALEDTLFYRYGPLLSRNEVGASPDVFSLSADDFHDCCASRARAHPRAMLATATHDHKRGEDTRARLAALTEMPARWMRLAQDWIDALPPGLTRADRYMLIQTFVGAWPAEWDADRLARDPALTLTWLERIGQWQLKALREAKLHTSWTDPDPTYEAAAQACLDFLAQAPDGRELLAAIAGFAMELAPAGMVNSFTQTLLRNTLPGVPDLYQGADLWDLSLVDPDNRRPVDYTLRAALLAESARDPAMPLSAAAWRDGAVKQALIHRLLMARQRLPGPFMGGDFLRVQAEGSHARHVLAFLRRQDGQNALIVACRHCALQVADYARGDAAAARGFWNDTALRLPGGISGLSLHDALTGRRVRASAGGLLPLVEILRDGPAALCLSA